MANLANIRLNRKKPIICVPCTGETVGDICYCCQQIREKPHDIIEYNAGTFNGLPNLSQLWNALLMITQATNEGTFIFKCEKKDLPEYCRTERDYKDIMTFALRSGLPVALEIAADTDPDLIADLSEQCMDTGLIPIISLSLDAASDAASLEQRLTDLSDLEARTFHITFPAQTTDDIDAVLQAVRDFLQENYEFKVIIQPTGPVAKAELLKGNTFDSPILYAAVNEETESLPSCTDLRRVLDEKGL